MEWRVCPPPPLCAPFLRPCYRIRDIINGIKVLSYWKADIERSQIFRPASLVGRDNSTEIFINSNIIVFTPEPPPHLAQLNNKMFYTHSKNNNLLPYYKQTIYIALLLPIAMRSVIQAHLSSLSLRRGGGLNVNILSIFVLSFCY